MAADRNSGTPAYKSAAGILLGACSVVLSACWDTGFDCMTLQEYDRIAATKPVLVGVMESFSTGEIVKEDPSNWMTGSKFTGETCTVAVDFQNGNAFATVSFLEEPVELVVPLSERDFYMGLVDRDFALVVQQVPEGAGASLVTFGEDGVLQYGACGEHDSWFRDCHIAPAGT